MSYTLSGSQQTLGFPTYNGWTGSTVFPSNSSIGSASLTIKTSQNNFDNVSGSGASAGYSTRTKDFYWSLGVNSLLIIAGGSTSTLVPFTLTSPCISSGTTYFVDEFATGTGFQYSESKLASGNSVTLDIKTTVNPLPAGVTIDVVVSH